MSIQQRSEQFFSVIYHLNLDMDYEGFRQMVLGANLFSVKSS